MSGFFNTFFFQPLYNGLIFLMDILPGIDAGVAVILFTIVIKLILFPLSRTAVITQMKMKKIAPEIKKVQDQYKEDRQEQARKMLELYKANKVNPFSSFFLILLQLPIIFALYKVFLTSGLPEVNESILYSFVAVPASINIVFLGIINITQKSFLLAFLAAITNFFQVRFAMPPAEPKPAEASLKSDLARSMQFQMRYVLPVIVFVIAYTISGAIALYWTTSNLFMIGQELYLRKKYKNKEQNGTLPAASAPVLSEGK